VEPRKEEEEEEEEEDKFYMKYCLHVSIYKHGKGESLSSYI